MRAEFNRNTAILTIYADKLASILTSNRPGSPDIIQFLSKYNMATARNNELSMESLVIRDDMGATLESLPNEVIGEILDKLTLDHETVYQVFAGSKTLASAQASLGELRNFSMTSQRMGAIARPYLYRVIVIPAPNKLTCLHRSLVADPTLGNYINSLAVLRHYDLSKPEEPSWLANGRPTRAMSLSEFSQTFVAILKNTPRLITLSLVRVLGTKSLEEAYPFDQLVDSMAQEISIAKNASNDREFLPMVKILGILRSRGETLGDSLRREHEIFKDLLNLPNLEHILVIRDPDAFGAGVIENHVDFLGESIQMKCFPHATYISCVMADARSALDQRSPSLRKTVKKITLRSPCIMQGRDIGAIGALFPHLESLSTWHKTQRQDEPIESEYQKICAMKCLKNLDIRINPGDRWSHCTWFSPSLPYNLSKVPMLETLRIPLRYFQDSEKKPGCMFSPELVLPASLKNLELYADLRLDAPWHVGVEGADVGQVIDENPGEKFEPVSWTIGFLEDVYQLIPSHFPGLVDVVLEHASNPVDRDDVKFEALKNSFASKGIRFRTICTQELWFKPYWYWHTAQNSQQQQAIDG